MKRIKTNIMDTPITLMGIITVLCCILLSYATDGSSLQWAQTLNLTVLLIDFIIVIGWCIWATYIFWRKKVLTPLTTPVLRLLNQIGFVLIAYWIVVRIFPEAIGLWFIPIDIAIWLGVLIIVVRTSRAPAME